ncbi:MAG: O-antigen ligase family protein [Acidobacteriota bacterium]|nr:O-antigen ligase family protein [Acidobacteriota bacterium]
MSRWPIGWLLVLLAALAGGGGTGVHAGFVWHTLLVGWLAVVVVRGRPADHEPTGELRWMVVAFSLAIALTMIRGSYLYGAWLTAVECGAFFAVSWLTARRGVTIVETLLPWLLVAASTQSVWMVVQAWTREDVVRPAGTLFNPNHAGAWLAMIVLLQAARLFRNPRAAWWIPLPLIGLFWTQSRGAFLGLIVGLVLLGILNRDRLSTRSRRWLLAGLVGSAIVIGGIVLVRFTQDDPFRFHRLRIGSAVASLIADNPWTGVGVGQFADAAESVRFADGVGLYRYDRRFSTTHSDWLRLPVEWGLPLTLWVVVAIYRRLRRLRLTSPDGSRSWGMDGALAALAAWVVQSGVDNLSMRPAVFLLAAVLVGVLFSGPRRSGGPRLLAARPRRLAVLGLLLLVWVVGELAPWSSWRDREATPPRLDRAARHHRLDPEIAMRMAEQRLYAAGSPDLLLYAEARGEWERAIDLRPRHAVYHRRAARLEARICLSLFRDVACRERASSRFAEASRWSPYDAGVALEHGLFLLDAGDPAAARRQAETARRLEPIAALPHLVIAEALIHESLFGDAELALREALRLAEQFATDDRQTPEERKYGQGLSALPAERVASIREALAAAGGRS